MPYKVEVTEITVKELAIRTKRYFLQSVINHLIEKYLLIIDELAEHMYRNFGVCIVLEDNLDYNDLIDGAY